MAQSSSKSFYSVGGPSLTPVNKLGLWHVCKESVQKVLPMINVLVDVGYPGGFTNSSS